MSSYHDALERLRRYKVFFSFDFDQDAWRAGQVRNSGITKDLKEVGFVDKVAWEQVKYSSDSAIKAWIDRQLEGTSVTVVLVGRYTSGSRWVNYEIEQSIARGNALLAITIHNLKDQYGQTDYAGINPLTKHTVYDKRFLFARPASDIFKTYDWAFGGGYYNLGNWVNEAKDIAANLVSQTMYGGLKYGG